MQTKLFKKINYPSHEDLIKILWQLNYRGDGYMCYGYAGAAIPALLLNEWGRFNTRLKYIKMILDRVQEPPYKGLIEPAKKAIEDLKQGKMTPLEPEDVEIIDEIPAFFEAMELHYQPEQYKEWFEAGKAQSTQDVVQTIPLTLPKKLSSIGSDNPIVASKRYIGFYSVWELEIYFKTLRTILNKKRASIVLLLSSTSHSMLVGYHYDNQFWTRADICDIPIIRSRSNWKLAKDVSFFFTDNYIAGFSTQMFALDKPLLDEVLHAWTNTREWRRIHEITDSRALYRDWNNSTLLHLAAQNGDLAGVQAILKLNKPWLLNHQNNLGATALHLAIEERQEDVVHELLSHNANYFQQDNRGNTPYGLALCGDAFDLALILLRHVAKDAQKESKNPPNIPITIAFLDYFCARCPQEYKEEANQLRTIFQYIRQQFLTGLMRPKEPSSSSESSSSSEPSRIIEQTSPIQEHSKGPLFFNSRKRRAPLSEELTIPKCFKTNLKEKVYSGF
jgi:hypothetical protein